MKIAVTAQGPTPDSPVDQRFGRACWRLIYDGAGQSWDPLENSAARNALQGRVFRCYTVPRASSWAL